MTQSSKSPNSESAIDKLMMDMFWGHEDEEVRVMTVCNANGELGRLLHTAICEHFGIEPNGKLGTEMEDCIMEEMSESTWNAFNKIFRHFKLV